MIGVASPVGITHVGEQRPVSRGRLGPTMPSLSTPTGRKWAGIQGRVVELPYIEST